MARFPRREECVLGDFLRARADAAPDDAFAIFEDADEWTFAETAARSRRCAGGLAPSGTSSASRSSDGCRTVRRRWSRGSAPRRQASSYTPLNTGYKGALLEDALNLLRARVVVAHAGLLERLVGLDLERVERVVVVGDMGDVPRGLPEVVPWAEVAAGGRRPHRTSGSRSSRGTTTW